MPASDHELLAAWRDGDRTAGRTLVDRYYGSLHRFFRSKRIAECNDLIQDTMLACLERSETIRAEDVRGFLFGIARHKLYQLFASRYRVEIDEVSATSLVDLGASPSQARLAKEEQLLVLRALRALPLADQVLLELYYWEDLTARELAEALDIPEGTVRSRLRLVKERFEGELHAAARDKRHLDSTMDNLEAWARAVGSAHLPKSSP